MRCNGRLKYVINDSEFSVLPYEVVLKIMSYWRPGPLPYLEAIHRTVTFTEFGCVRPSFSVNRLMLYRCMYKKYAKFRDHIHAMMLAAGMDVVARMEADPDIQARMLSCNEYTILIAKATYTWNAMKLLGICVDITGQLFERYEYMYHYNHRHLCNIVNGIKRHSGVDVRVSVRDLRNNMPVDYVENTAGDSDKRTQI